MYRQRGEQISVILLIVSIALLKTIGFAYCKKDDILPDDFLGKDTLCQELTAFSERQDALSSNPYPKRKDGFSVKSANTVLYVGKTDQQSFHAKTTAVSSQRYFSETAMRMDSCLLNTADTTDLMAFRGVGSYTATQILRYRERLGGFYAISQLDEIPYLRPENLTELKKSVRLDTTEIRLLILNVADMETLKEHPYINDSQARALVSLRRYHGRLDNMDDLVFLEEFSAEDLQKLRPYLSFE